MNYPDHKSLDNVLDGVFDNYYKDWNYKYIFCACGTATTFTGLCLKAKTNSIIVGVSVLKGENEKVFAGGKQLGGSIKLKVLKTFSNSDITKLNFINI